MRAGAHLLLREDKDLWATALKSLDVKDRQRLAVSKSAERIVLNDIVRLVEGKKALCLQRRWKFKRSSGELVILRDVFEKILHWVNKFKEAGDIIVQYDPAHAALPWAGVRFLLQVYSQ